MTVNTLKLQAFQTQIQGKFGGMHRLHDQPPDPASFSGKASSRKDGDSDGSSGPPSSIDFLDLQSRRSGMGCDSEVREATTRSKGLSTLHGEEDPVVETDSTMDNAMDDISPRAAEPVCSRHEHERSDQDRLLWCCTRDEPARDLVSRPRE